MSSATRLPSEIGTIMSSSPWRSSVGADIPTSLRSRSFHPTACSWSLSPSGSPPAGSGTSRPSSSNLLKVDSVRQNAFIDLCRHSMGALPSSTMRVIPSRTYWERAGLVRYVETSTRSPTLPGWRTAMLRAMWAPMDQPRRCTLSMPSASSTATASSAMSSMQNSPEYTVSPTPRLSRVRTPNPSRRGTILLQ